MDVGPFDHRKSMSEIALFAQRSEIPTISATVRIKFTMLAVVDRSTRRVFSESSQFSCAKYIFRKGTLLASGNPLRQRAGPTDAFEAEKSPSLACAIDASMIIKKIVMFIRSGLDHAPAGYQGVGQTDLQGGGVNDEARRVPHEQNGCP